MKLTPREKQIQARMQPGAITINGFLGDDERHFHEIISDDRRILERLGITVQELADKMKYLTDKAFDNYDETVIVEEIHEVSYNTVRGRLICPFMHPGSYRKGEVVVKNLKNNLTVKWTPLSVHMIEVHGFFEGKGSKNRIEPEILYRVLFGN